MSNIPGAISQESDYCYVYSPKKRILYRVLDDKGFSDNKTQMIYESYPDDITTVSPEKS